LLLIDDDDANDEEGDVDDDGATLAIAPINNQSINQKQHLVL
jgi:hypothetical protein